MSWGWGGGTDATAKLEIKSISMREKKKLKNAIVSWILLILPGRRRGQRAAVTSSHEAGEPAGLG